MNYLFNTPVFIKPLGIIASPDQVGNSLSLHMNMVRKYSLAEPESLADQLMVKSLAVITVSASFILPNSLFALKDGAVAYNAAQREAAAAIVANSQTPATLEVTPRRRGRRAKVVEVPEDDEVTEDNTEALIESQIFNRAISINFLEVIIEEKTLPLEESEPFRLRTEGKEKNELAFNNAIALITQINKKIGQLRNTLAAPGVNDMTAAGSIVANFEEEVTAIDRQGVENYENSLRSQIGGLEERARERISFLKEKIIDKVNEEAHVSIRPFVGDWKSGSAHISQEEVLKAIKDELFVPISL